MLKRSDKRTFGVAWPVRVAGRGDPETHRVACMLCPGGFEHAGGIGRWAGYLFEAWPSVPHAPVLEMVDTRGHGGVLTAGAAFVTAVVRVVWLVLGRRLGLLHLNLSVRGSTARKCVVSALAYRLGVPVVVHLHSGRFDLFYRALPGWAKGSVDRMFARAASIIVPGRIWADMLVDELGVLRSRILVMPNAVAGPEAVPVRPSGGECHIVMLGRMWPAKGLPELMEALGSAAMRELPWRITMAGDGDPDTYRKDADERGIGSKVTILGWQDSDGVAALLASADVLVLPSRSENLPVSVVEAMSYRVAVVTTPVGAIPEIVETEVSALLVPVQDPAALATALRRLVTDPELRHRIAQGGLDAFERRLDIRSYARALSNIYGAVLRGEPVMGPAA